MASSPLAIDTLQRLVAQVQGLSSVVETLTLRLLELEERLQVQERHGQEAHSRSLGPLAECRLAETEERLSGLEQLLAHSPLPGSASAAEGIRAAGLGSTEPASVGQGAIDPLGLGAHARLERSGGADGLIHPGSCSGRRF